MAVSREEVSKKSSELQLALVNMRRLRRRAASATQKLLVANFSHYLKKSLCSFYTDFVSLAMLNVGLESRAVSEFKVYQNPSLMQSSDI